MFNEFKESGIEVLLGLWFAKTDFIDLKNSIMKDISRRFAARGNQVRPPAAKRADLERGRSADRARATRSIAPTA